MAPRNILRESLMKQLLRSSLLFYGAVLIACDSTGKGPIGPGPGPTGPTTPQGPETTPVPAPIVPVAVKSLKARENPAVPPEDRTALAAGNAAFALKLFAQLDKSDKNVVFSPASISTALAGAYAGARTETEAQMAKALQFTLPQDRLHPAMNLLSQELSARGQGAQGADNGPFRLNTVNAVWARKDYEFVPAFLDVQAQSYGAGINILDFANSPEPSRGTINKWVAEQTSNRIPELLPPKSISEGTTLVLTNAVYLNAAWKLPFTENTFDGEFNRADGSKVNARTMGGRGQYRSAKTPQYDAVSLPYEDERLSMLIVAPKDGSYASWESALTPATLDEVVASLRENDVVLQVPRFKIDFRSPLKTALSALGMPLAFSGAADFSGISASPMTIDEVLHQSFISVAEKGTEAAAATAVIFRDAGVSLAEYLKVNRPFLFFIRDEPTGAIVFMGRVMDPNL